LQVCSGDALRSIIEINATLAVWLYATPLRRPYQYPYTDKGEGEANAQDHRQERDHRIALADFYAVIIDAGHIGAG
jgi:hypothetical protein